MTPDEMREHEAAIKKIRKRWNLAPPRQFGETQGRIGLAFECPKHPGKPIFMAWRWHYEARPHDFVTISPPGRRLSVPGSDDVLRDVRCLQRRCTYSPAPIAERTIREAVDREYFDLHRLVPLGETRMRRLIVESIRKR